MTVKSHLIKGILINQYQLEIYKMKMMLNSQQPDGRSKLIGLY